MFSILDEKVTLHAAYFSLLMGIMHTGLGGRTKSKPGKTSSLLFKDPQ